ncbi:hypothetical protein [Verrucomicrobium sp. BvORR106]|uniref:hypothetical protein n=1 Tax=Verrucomicrobium sp. BvORR106 TaxID=1403819 RepID=UPI00056F8187|nr:hypothetical protein [Verrucomicrobium sp. BvORR106]
MNITAREHYRKGRLLPFVSWKIDSVTTFGDYEVAFDLPRLQVVRSKGSSSEVIAQIREGHQGRKLSEFFGTVESNSFLVTKRKTDWLSGMSGNVTIDITQKDSGSTHSHLVMRGDFFNSFKVEHILDLKLAQDDRAHHCRFKVAGTCAAEHQDLAEVLACLLLHHSEESGPST